MLGEMSVSGHRSYKCGAVYDCSEHIVEVRKISNFQYAVCGETIESRSSASVPRYRFIACPARAPNVSTPNALGTIIDIATEEGPP